MVVAELLTKLGFQVDPRELNRGITHAKSALTELKGFIAKLGIGYAAYKIGKSVLGTARELESLNVQLKTMVGPDKATMLFKGIIDYAKTTAFYVKDVTGAVSTMIQGMVAVPDIMPKIAQLGDIAMNSDQLTRLAYAYAQVNRQGYMTNYESRRFLQGGNFGVFQQFAMSEAVQQGRMKKGQEVQKGSDLDNQLRARQGELFNMAKKHQFTIGMLDQAIAYATTQGGIFYRHQLEQVKTFEGAWSNMWDVLSINTGLAMQKLFPIMKQLMMFVTSIDLSWMSAAFQKLGDAIQFVAYKVVQAGFLTAWTAFKEAFADLVKALPGGSGELVTLGWVIGKLLTGVVWLGVGLVELARILVNTYKWFKENSWATIGLGLIISSMFVPRLLMGVVAFKQMSTGISTLGTLLKWFRQDALLTTLIVLEQFAGGFVGAFKSMAIFMTLFKANALLAIEVGIKSLGTALVTTMTGIQVATPIWIAALGILVWQLYRLNSIAKETFQIARENTRHLMKADVAQYKADIAEKLRQMEKLPQNSFQRTLLAGEIAGLNKKIADTNSKWGDMGAASNPDMSPAEYAASQSADTQKVLKDIESGIAKILGPIQRTADNTDPSRSGGFGEASLLMTAIRGRLPSEIMNGVAEYD